MDTNSTLVELHALPVEEQLNFVFRAWDQIVDSGWTSDMSPELRAEIERRLAAHEADPSRVLSWDQVVASIRQSK